MGNENPVTGASTPCEMSVGNAGLPYRTEPLLARERGSFPSTVGALLGSGRGEDETELAQLTAEALLQGLASREPGRAFVAAFLMGRCRARNPTADAVLTQRLEEVLNGAPEPDVAIEAAMSLVLRGHLERGQEALRAALRSSHPLGDQYKAAFYLAELGDPSGYGALVNTLKGEIPHYRLMAARHALAFVPYQGREVDGLRVDLRELLVERLADPDELVRREVPFYLEELKMPDLRAVLDPVEKHDPSPSVRTAARIVLDRNR